MKVAIISTGSELMKGVVIDTNAAWIAQYLTNRALVPHRILVMGDNRKELSDTLKILMASYDAIICTGGLGPTTDDITALAVADALNVPVVRFAQAEAQIRTRFEARGVAMAAINLKQADLPTGSVILENQHGTAPGFLVNKSGSKALFLPGVPAEMKAMMELHFDALFPDTDFCFYQKTVCTFGIGESGVQELLMPLETQFSDVTFSYRASFPSITITVSGKNNDTTIASHNAVQQTLKRFTYADENKSLPAVLGEILCNKSLTISTAESCTGGLMGHLLTQNDGSSAYFKGSVVAYDNQVKTSVLGVEPILIQQQGAVCEAVSKQMATGVQQLLRTDIAMATSGIAGPSGGSKDKPVGTVHIAIAIENDILHKKCLFKGYSRTKVKTAAAWTAMKMILDYLTEKK